MASATLREIFATHSVRPLPPPPTCVEYDASADDYDWVYDDPDLVQFAGRSRRAGERKEAPLEAFA